MTALGPYLDGHTGLIVIESVAAEHACDRLFQQGKALIKTIEAHYEGDQHSGKTLLRRVTAALQQMEREELEPIELRHNQLKSALLAAKEVRRQQEEQARHAARLKLEADQRQQAEARAKELEAQAKQARGAEKQDLKAAAADLRQQPIIVPESAVDAVAPSADAAMQSHDRHLPWEFQLLDFDVLFEAAFRDKALRKYFKLDLVALNQQARADGSDLRIPGGRAIQRKTLV